MSRHRVAVAAAVGVLASAAAASPAAARETCKLDTQGKIVVCVEHDRGVVTRVIGKRLPALQSESILGQFSVFTMLQLRNGSLTHTRWSGIFGRNKAGNRRATDPGNRAVFDRSYSSRLPRQMWGFPETHMCAGFIRDPWRVIEHYESTACVKVRPSSVGADRL